MTRRRHLTRRRHAPRRIPQLLKIFCLCSTATGVFSLSDLSANLRSHEDSAPLLTMLLNVFADSDAPKEAPTLSGGSNSPLKRPASPALPAPRPPSAEPVAPRRALGLASLAFLSNLAYGVTSVGSGLVFHRGFNAQDAGAGRAGGRAEPRVASSPSCSSRGLRRRGTPTSSPAIWCCCSVG